MRALRTDWEDQLLRDNDLLRAIADKVGGPFHIMFPEQIADNIRGFQKVFADKGVTGLIRYGKKANKAACAVTACAQTDAGVDVSSVGELKAALAGGVLGENLMVTGPAKSHELLELAAHHGAVIAIDHLDEISHLAQRERADDASSPTRIVLRVLPPESNSRFGMTNHEIAVALEKIDNESVQLNGFSFHLPGYDPAPRAELAHNLIDRCLRAREQGHPASVISIGGGFSVGYVSKDDWSEFSTNYSRLWFHGDRGPTLDSYYPYHCETPGPDMLRAILEHNDLEHRLRMEQIHLVIEPGRALLAGAGSTVFQVQGRKTRQAHDFPYDILTVNGTSLSLSEQWFESEFLPDPVLWPLSIESAAAVPTCVGGATCLESDMLSRRRIPLGRRAETGDLLMYLNTAGYQMDSNESAFHELQTPPKVVVWRTEGNKLTYRFDDSTS